MKDNEIRQLMQDARVEILTLRRHNEILNAKVETMELMASINRPMPNNDPRPMGIDVAWQLDQGIRNLLERERINALPAAKAP